VPRPLRRDHHAVGGVDRGEEPGAPPGREHRHLLALRRHRLDLPVPAPLHRQVAHGDPSMSAHAPAATHPETPEHPEPAHGHSHHPNYVRVWMVLVVLLMISVFGPMVGIRWITLIAAFGVALVKAYMVAKNFMHLNIEKPIVHWMLAVVLLLMVLL